MKKIPLYLQILLGLVVGVLLGTALGPSAAVLDLPAKLILRVLGALAPPIVFLGVVQALLGAEFKGGKTVRLLGLLLRNTLVAIGLGLFVANAIQPGKHSSLPRPASPPKSPTVDVVAQLLDNVPDGLLRPLVENRVIGVVLVALAVGLAGRSISRPNHDLLRRGVETGFELVVRILHAVITLVPFAVLAKVAAIVGKNGLSDFVALGQFVVAVLVALGLQLGYYLLSIRLSSWVRPGVVLRGLKDALVMAFSTASSTATMPVTFERLKRLGVRDESATLGALVGSNFNNDGTALYEAMSALFIAQLLGLELTLSQQFLVVLTSVVASVGAAGIPEAGLVTMTLVFTAVGLPTEYIALLLTVDWFLDRARTTINVMGDVSVACILDGKVRAPSAPGDPPIEGLAQASGEGP